MEPNAEHPALVDKKMNTLPLPLENGNARLDFFLTDVPPMKTGPNDAGIDKSEVATNGNSTKADSPSHVTVNNDSKKVEEEATFPQQLMDVIEKETKEGVTIDGERVLEWLPAGDAFVIRDKKRFEKEVLPKYFNSKCKFMSFVRKLYRWGFRQVEKSLQGLKIFMHIHFVRGDKQRCLLMRSTVKKSTPRQAYTGALPTTSNFVQLNDPIMRNAIAAHQFPQQEHQQMHPNLNQGGDGFMNSNGMGIGPGGSSTLFVPSQFNQAAMGMMSANNIGNMFGDHRLERIMEQNRQQRQMQTIDMNMFHEKNVPAQSFSPPQAMMATNNSFGNSNFGAQSELELASEIMKRDSSIEPWKALELAKHFRK